MRLFLTGASGYIGLALCRRLARDGHELRALVRATSRVEPLEELGVRCFVGDVTDRYSMREAMSGAERVVHAAAELDLAAPAERMHRVNVEGSENVASLAWKLGVGGLLAISSIAAFGGSPDDGSPADESSPPMLPLPHAYSVSKREADRAIRGWAERGLHVDTVHPSLVYGPPGKKQGANALLRRVALGRMPAIVGGDRKLTLVHVDDVVEALVEVLERPAAPRADADAPGGDSWILAGDSVTVGELAGEVARLAGVRPPRLRLPVGAAALLMLALRPYYALRGFRPPLGAAELASLKRHWHFDDSKARRELGWQPRTLADGLPDTVEHLTRG